MDVNIFDIETDGLFHDVSTLWGIGIAAGADEPARWYEGDTGLDVLSKAELLAGHNIIDYDLPVLEKLTGWKPSPGTIIVDTLVLSRLFYSNLGELDKPGVPYRGSHSLGAWGERLGLAKLEQPAWDKFTPEMATYCCRDVDLNARLYRGLMKVDYSKEAVDLEHAFATIIARQVRHGVAFDLDAANKMYVELHSQVDELAQKIKPKFKGWFKAGEEFTPSRPNKSRGYTKGGTFTRMEWVDFNPTSRDHIAHVLKRDFKWNPTKFTAGGKPVVDERVLSGLTKYPGIAEIIDLLTVRKILGFLGDGKQSWLKHERNGRMHGRVNPNGAVTGRCTHSDPNLGNVPTRSAYGQMCRELFIAPDKKFLCGADASGLELRCLGGYMAHWDGGEYAKAAVDGNKEDGTDPHSLHASALGIDRNTAKTWFYAFIYGAGDAKLGSILGLGQKAGAESRARIAKKIPALGKLVDAVKKQAAKRGHLVGLDGRRLHVRSPHSALNTLLQAAGACLMKRALCILDENLMKAGLVTGEDYEFVLNVHDEWQVECINEPVAQLVGVKSENAFKLAGEYYGFGCPIAGESRIGKTWKETH